MGEAALTPTGAPSFARLGSGAGASRARFIGPGAAFDDILSGDEEGDQKEAPIGEEEPHPPNGTETAATPGVAPGASVGQPPGAEDTEALATMAVADAVS